MDSYEFYKKGRDAAWKALIKSGASSLPVSLDKVAAAYKIDIISAKKAKEKGLINGNINDLKVISVGETRTVIVDERGSRGETRFLMAKGIGLCLLAKERYIKGNRIRSCCFCKGSAYAGYCFGRSRSKKRFRHRNDMRRFRKSCGKKGKKTGGAL